MTNRDATYKRGFVFLNHLYLANPALVLLEDAARGRGGGGGAVQVALRGQPGEARHLGEVAAGPRMRNTKLVCFKMICFSKQIIHVFV